MFYRLDTSLVNIGKHPRIFDTNSRIDHRSDGSRVSSKLECSVYKSYSSCFYDNQ